MENKTNIPENILQICRDIAKVAGQHGLFSLSGEFQPQRTGWMGKVGFKWEAGRHNEDADEITVWSNFNVVTKVSSTPPIVIP